LSPPSETRDAETEVASNFDADTFRAAVGRAIRYVHDGDIMQVVLSQRLSRPFAGSSLSLYRALRSINPSPYMFYFDFGDFQVVSASPEILVRLERGTVTVRPIAGTRRRGATQDEDAALERELLADPKERAEHVMLADLGRNDVGRVAATGTVRLTETMTVERYSHVMHIVSNVEGRLRDGLDCIDVFRAAFPAGTVSGAPKVRAMEIIDELEPDKRGVYAGAAAIWVQRRYGPGHCDPHGRRERRPDARAGGCRDRRRLGARKRIAGNPCQGARRAARRRDRLERNGRASMILMIDNYDSFTWNLVQYLGELGADVKVFRNDEIAAADIAAMDRRPSSFPPGPARRPKRGSRSRRYASLPAGSRYWACASSSGDRPGLRGEVVHAGKVVHGKTSTITHSGLGVFRGLPSPFVATRYHSLAIRRATLPKCLEGHRRIRGRRNHGRAPPRARRGGRAVPPRVLSHRARARALEKFPAREAA